jgi:hypothetical protein
VCYLWGYIATPCVVRSAIVPHCVLFVGFSVNLRVVCWAIVPLCVLFVGLYCHTVCCLWGYIVTSCVICWGYSAIMCVA